MADAEFSVDLDNQEKFANQLLEDIKRGKKKQQKKKMDIRQKVINERYREEEFSLLTNCWREGGKDEGAKEFSRGRILLFTYLLPLVIAYLVWRGMAISSCLKFFLTISVIAVVHSTIRYFIFFTRWFEGEKARPAIFHCLIMILVRTILFGFPFVVALLVATYKVAKITLKFINNDIV